MTAVADTRVPFAELVERALEQGLTQVEAVGSPLHPFLLDDRGRMLLLFDEQGGVDPMELACAAIKTHAADAAHCALVLDSRLTFADGKKWDAIVVMACVRGSDEGVVRAQRYVPKGLFRKFRREGVVEDVGTSKDFISVALEDAA